MKHAVRHIHFVGVGGAGMSGIAEVLFNLGYQISGSDLSDSATLRRLAGLGIKTCLGHAAAHIEGADAVVTSTAVTADNPEVLAARDKKIPVVPRALMLAELMRLKQGIAIAGTHGKTTTTSLVTSVLAEAGLDPTFVIGGRLNSAGANAKLGSGDYIVVEADESDASFLNLLPVMAVVTSTAVQADNPEVIAAREKKIPVVPRALMLAELMRLKQGIAIAGTHGKTTTTSLVASVLAAAGLDPTFVIGGRLNSAGANAQLGSGDYIVVEADESDASFLNLLPVMAVVTNIDADHMETYGHDFGRLKGAFVDFLHRMPFYGTAVLCVDSPAVREILPHVTCPVTSYGFSEDAQVRAVNVRAQAGQMHFTVQRRNGVTLPDLDIVLNLAGEHNVLNALSAIAIAVELNIPDEAVQRALAGFKGVGRRFQSYGNLPAKDGGQFTVIDDYGHHPVEMAATLAAARGAFPGRRLVLAFQPHRYSRTRDCFEDFVKVIGSADAVLLTEVYAAGEAPVVAADGRSLARALRVAGRVEPLFVDNVADLPQTIADNARDGDVVMCMGAGSIGLVPGKVVDLLQNSELAPLAGKAQ